MRHTWAPQRTELEEHEPYIYSEKLVSRDNEENYYFQWNLRPHFHLGIW